MTLSSTFSLRRVLWPVVLVLAMVLAVAPATPAYAATAPAAGDLLVVDAATVSVITVNRALGSRTTMTSGGLLVTPRGVVVTPGGSVLVVDEAAFGGGGGVVRVDPVTGAQTPVAQGGSFVDPTGIALDASGAILVADRSAFGGAGGVIRVDPATGAQTTVSSGGSFVDPYGLAVEASGSIVVVDRGAFKVIRVDAATGAQSTVATGGSLTSPFGIAVEAGGGILVTDGSTSAIVRVDAATGAQSTVAQGGMISLPIGVAVERSGQIVVAGAGGTGAVTRLDRTTGAQTPASTGTFPALLGIAVVPGVPANGPPRALDDTFHTPKSTALTAPAPGVLANDFDVDGDPLTAVLVTAPAGAVAFTLRPDGSFDFTPPASVVADFTFTYRVRATGGEVSVATATISVDPTGTAPVAYPDSYSTGLGAALTVPAPGVLVNDPDIDGDPTTALLTRPPKHAASFTFTADGSFTYTPVAGFAGVDTFQYRSTGGGLTSSVGRVSIGVGAVTPVLRPAVATPFAGSAPAAATLADVDGDGIPDLLGTVSDALSVRRGLGGGVFGPSTQYPVGRGRQCPRFEPCHGALPVALTVADFNGDGDPDVATANYAEDSVSILLGGPGATFGPATTVRIGDGYEPDEKDYQTSGFDIVLVDTSDNPAAIAAADVDGDGKLDLVIPERPTGKATTGTGGSAASPIPVDPTTLSVLHGDGAGGFGGLQTSDIGVTAPDPEFSLITASRAYSPGVAVADMDGDHDPDLAITLAGGNAVAVARGGPGASFGRATMIPVGQLPGQIVARDLNGDGDPDLAVVNAGPGDDTANGSVSVLLGGAGTTFAAQPPQFAVAQGSSTGLAVADLNGDSRPDLAITSDTDATLSVFANVGGGRFASGVGFNTDTRNANDQLAGQYPIAAVTADVDGDGDIDVVTINAADYSLLLNDPTFVPGVHPDSYTTPQDTALVVNGPGVLANDTDDDGLFPRLESSFSSSPAHGTVTSSGADGSFTYVPDPGFVGSDAFFYEAIAQPLGMILNPGGIVFVTVTGPAAITAASGDKQTAAVGTAFPSPLVAAVVDAAGKPLPSTPVRFTVTAGGATFPGGAMTATVPTNASGQASSPVLTAGAAPGPVMVTATAGTRTVTFTGTTDAGPAATVTAASGDNQTAVAGSAFAAPLVAAVADRFGNLVTGAPVTFAVTTGAATFPGGAASVTVPTGASGAASPVLTAGGAAGPVTVTATAGSLSVRFAGMVTAGPAATVTAASGDNQTAVAGSAFAAPLVAAVADQFGNVVAGAPVTFALPPASTTTGSATFAGGGTSAVVTTGADGRATSPVITAVTAGPVLATATVGSLPAAAFPLSVTAAGPARADLRIALTAPAGAAPNASVPVTVTITNAGPSAASKLATSVLLPRGWTVVNPAGGTVVGGRLVVLRAATLASGASTTYALTLRAGPAKGAVLLLGGVLSGTQDPNYRNNIAVGTTKVQ